MGATVTMAARRRGPIAFECELERENFWLVIIGSFAVDGCRSGLPLPRWGIWTDSLKLFAIEIPVAKISPDDGRGGRRGGRHGGSGSQQFKVVQALRSLLGIVRYLQPEVV